MYDITLRMILHTEFPLTQIVFIGNHAALSKDEKYSYSAPHCIWDTTHRIIAPSETPRKALSNLSYRIHTTLPFSKPSPESCMSP